MPDRHFNKKYIRYTTRGRSGSLQEEAEMEEAGLFVSAYRLRDDNSLLAAEQQELQQCLRWFERHVRLACLDELSGLDQQARCWYKNPDQKVHALEYKASIALGDQAVSDDAPVSAGNPAAENLAAEASVYPEATAHQALAQTERLAEMMQRHGFVVHVEQTDRPGVILHGYNIQVAAIPARNAWHASRLRLQLWCQRHILMSGF